MGMTLLTAGSRAAGLMFSVSRSDQIIQLVKDQGDFFIGNFASDGAVFSHPALEHPPEQQLDRLW